MSRKGRFIVFEGGDGCGKTTQMLNSFSAISSFAINEGGFKGVKTFSEPGGFVGSILKESILGRHEIDPFTELFLFSASRVEQVSVIKRYLKQGYLVLCDRFIDSTIAYQGFGHEIPLPTIHHINNLSRDGLLPDLTLWLDVKPEIAIKRIKKLDTIESRAIEFHNRVYSGYQSLEALDDKFQRIDGDRRVEDVSDEIQELVLRIFEIWN